MPFWAYILHCRGGVFYTGHTDDLEHRVAQHESGAIAGFTSQYLPVKLVWSQEFLTRQEAFEAELRIKGWSRAKKLALIRGDWEAVSRHAKGKSGPSTSSGRAGFEEILITRAALQSIHTHTAACRPQEACGILLGEGIAITGALPAKNIHPAPRTHFEIDPQTLIDVHRAARAGGPQVLGYYHSHPTGPARPSATDAAQAPHDGAIWAIIGQEGDVTFWRDEETGFCELPYTVVAG